VLKRCVWKLRKAFQEDSKHPTVIETIPKGGYRLLLPVHLVESEADSISDTFASKRDAPSTRRLIGRLSFLVITFGLITVVYLSVRPRLVKLPLELLPVTTLPGFEGSPTFSPDGEQIAFEYNNGTFQDIFTKRLDDEKMVRLTEPPGWSFCPRWSPNGKYIAYFHGFTLSPQEAQFSLQLMNPLGGAKRKLMDGMDFRGVLGCGCVSWSPDSKSLVFARVSPEESLSGIFVMNIEDPKPRRVLPTPASMADRNPSYSRNGKQIAFVRMTSLGTSDIYVVPSSGGEPKRLTFENTSLAGPVWTSDDKRIIFSGGFGGSGWSNDIYSVPVTGGDPEKLSFTNHRQGGATLSIKGDKMVYMEGIFDPNIWKIDLRGPSAPSKFISSTWVDNNPDFSPDGTRIAFLSDRDGTLAIWICNRDGSNPERLVASPGGGMPRWSPLGDLIAFDSRASGHSQVYVVDSHGGTASSVTQGDYDNMVPAWSTDGKWIYFSSNRTGEHEIWKTSPVTKETVRVTTHGGYYAEESVDGKFLYYIKPTDRNAAWTYAKPGIYGIPISGGRESLLVPGAQWLWRSGKKGIYFVDDDAKQRPVLKLFRASTGRTEILANLDKRAWGGAGGIAVSPDGKTFLYAQIDGEGSDLMLAKNGSW